VLEKTGFRRIGLVERYLFVGGRWQDNYLYELVGPDVTPASSA
jgi:RimJ/RimL family protein N-acetyltransferase